MLKAQKETEIANLVEIFSSSGSVVVSSYCGMTVSEIEMLRSKMREQGGRVRVIKNRLAKIAVANHPAAVVGDLFKGMVMIGYAAEIMTAPKVLCKFAEKNDKLSIIGGVLGGEFFDAEKIQILASLPTLDELRANLLGIIEMPAVQIARIVQEPARRVACVVGERGK